MCAAEEKIHLPLCSNKGFFTCPNNRSTAVTNYTNNGSMSFRCPRKPRHAGIHNYQCPSLAHRHLNRMESLVTHVFDKSKCQLWERSIGEVCQWCGSAISVERKGKSDRHCAAVSSVVNWQLPLMAIYLPCGEQQANNMYSETRKGIIRWVLGVVSVHFESSQALSYLHVYSD